MVTMTRENYVGTPMMKRAEKIRKIAKEYLKGNSFGAGTQKIINETGMDFSMEQVGQALALSDEFVNVSSGNRYATWILSEELEN